MSNFGKLQKTLVSPNLQRVISVSLIVLEIFGWIVDLSLTKISFTETIIYKMIQLQYSVDFTSYGASKSAF